MSIKTPLALLLSLGISGAAHASVGSPSAPRVERKLAQLKRQADKLRKTANRLGQRGVRATSLLVKVQKRLRLVEKRLSSSTPKTLPN